MSLIKLNKYTLLETGTPDKIHFYIEASMLDKEINKKENDLHITFEITKEKEDKLYDMHIFLINKNREIVYRSYSVYLKEIDKYNYAILDSRNDITHAEVMPKNTINFNTLDYNTLTKLLASVEEFTNMVPDLTAALKNYKEEINVEKEVALTIDIPTPTNYFHNVVGNNILLFEQVVANEKEQDITNRLLSQAKKRFEVVLNNDYDKKLSLLNLMSFLLNKVKSTSLIPKPIIKDTELKIDTNKEELSLDELQNTLNSFIKQEDLDSDNIISERIHYILESKPKLKEITNFVKVIFTDNEYVDTKRRVRAIKEETLKDLLINSFIEETYLPLPRNEVLIYHLKNSKTIDFLCVISLDLIYNLYKTYKYNSIDENVESVKLLEDTLKLYDDKNISAESYIKITIEIITMMYLYYLKNINSKALMFNKGDYIIDLGYYKGEFDIKIINKNTNKIHGKLIKITEDISKEINDALHKNEKAFIDYINNLIHQNLYIALVRQKLIIDMKDQTHKGIKYILRRPSNQNIFECSFPIEDILLILMNPNKKKTISKKVEEEIKEDPNYKYNIPVKDYEYIIRKSDTIAKIMENSPLKNKDYQEITKLYKKLQTVEDDKKTDFLLKLASLFKIEITDIKKENIE